MDKKPSVEDEVKELRRQMEQTAPEEPVREKVAEPSKEAEPASGAEDLPGLRGKLDEFLGMLQKDLRETPATAAVGIFAIGVLVGRLLSR